MGGGWPMPGGPLGAGACCCCCGLTRWLSDGPLWIRVSSAFWTLGLSKLMPEAELGGRWLSGGAGPRPRGMP